ncbi:urease subunit gamma [Pseudonocardia sichuanensis]|uniref:urease n=1 Tax=Pseudonocardia kunmingensis TaxID=630975 RepID=A0A543DX62_9PSEU|nr:urease subunit gamma [Pseudonocardia kunmingensis]TQM13920.1 urease subunit gamma/beta [Pseudonocardia kunmingensis]
MHLTPREHERLLLAAGADLARRRLARGARLGAPDAVALVCDEICELAWDGVPYEEVVSRARKVVSPGQLVDGVASAVPALQVEALFPHGSVLVHVDAPFGEPPLEGPGSVRTGHGGVELAPGRERATALLRNTGELPIWVSSHVPLDQLNPAVQVEVPGEGRFRLDVPAGTALRVEPGAERQVEVVRIGGGA